ncbi:MAG: hypothetical protein H7289_01580 [Mucilaginibacter sp.]|nr:hypothetical protein [Mucilaginibacter sp.]
MKKICTFLMVIASCSLSGYAREIVTDTTSIMVIARHDAEKFSFDKVNKKAVIRNLGNPNSDYFKPSEKTSQVSLLNDSLYVQTFKTYAIKHIKAKRTAKTLLIVGGSVVVVLGLIVAALVAGGPGIIE